METKRGFRGDDPVMVAKLQSRRLMLWRCVALVLLIVLLALPGWKHYHASIGLPASHIARLSIRGMIGNDVAEDVKKIHAAARDDHVRGLLLVVDSPGGGVTGGEQLHDAIADFARRKPVAVSMGNTAASAAYMISVPARRIFALSSTITGSIGVIMERPDLSVLMGKVGVSVHGIASGPMKDQTQPFSALRPDGRDMLQNVVNDLFQQFVAMVAQGRHLPVEQVMALADGRPFTGRQAIGLKLIDALGDEEDARAWLRRDLKVADDFPVTDLRDNKKRLSLWGLNVSRHALLSLIMGDEASEKIVRILSYQKLDGALALLQP